jgi:CDP-paratose 2-epimerase
MKAIITGGAGFVGSNLAARLIREGNEVVIFDDLSRKGADKNIEWLTEFGTFTLIRDRIQDAQAVERLIDENKDADLVVHLAAQVAVTTSVVDPRSDFNINMIGTMNLLEAIRKSGTKPFTIFASTNKVYGKLADVAVVEKDDRYAYGDIVGIDETFPLDFYSPYGCSKGGADQYMHDYGRIYDLPTCVFRMSCIYGPRQFGVEDQGWVAWFAIAALTGQPITIFGDGKQVRDVLFVEDLIDLYLTAYEKREECGGRVYNAGGGPNNTLSLLELLAQLEDRLGKKIPREFADWRPGDQQIYVSDISYAGQCLEWKPKVSAAQGVDKLIDWVKENQRLFK